MPRSTYEQMDGGGSGGGGGPGDGGDESPMSMDDYERPPLRHIDKYIKPELPCIHTTRYTIAIMTCIGFIISFGMRCNMGMAKLSSMPVEESADVQHFHHNGTIGSNRTIHAAMFNWTVSMESAIDTSFFYGYLITQLPGGILAAKFPANRLFGTAIACSTFLNLFIPGAIMWDPYAVILLRAMQGFVEGVTYPACHGIWRYWAPPMERSRLATIAFSGSYAGIVIGMPMSGMLTGWISWKAAFYFYGVMGMFWYASWLWLSFEKPRVHPAITIKELKYIEKSLGESNPVTGLTSFKAIIQSTPWKAFFTSMPVYAIIVANFCRSWNFYLLVLYQSAYLKQTFNFKIQSTGLVGALPHLLMTMIVPYGGILADYLRKNKILSTTMVRKVFNCGGYGLEGIFFLVVAHATTAPGAITALSFGVAASAFAVSGYNVNHLDIAPKYASILMGLSNGIGTIAGLICPVAIDHITRDQPPECWKIVFKIAATVHLIGCTFYAIFASGELQPWAEQPDAERKVWTPTTGAGLGPGGYMKETSFNEPEHEQLNVQPNNGQNGYGAMQQHVSSNPFAYAASIAEEQVQPEAQDSYMHGNIEDRTY